MCPRSVQWLYETDKRRLACLKTTKLNRVSDGSVSIANCSKGAEPIVYRYSSLTCVLRKFASDMSHCPSKVNNEIMHCHGLFKYL
jgi:hypothetical protein